MIKTITQMSIDGYGAGETDFATRFSLSDPQVQLDFETEIIQPILAVLSSSDQTAVLTINGHSDRVDTEGLTREQRRQQEFEASQARSTSADEGVKEIIRSRFLGFVPADLDELQQIAILPRPAGAAVLREGSELLTEEQRKRNRRVQFRVVRFQPS
jgi:methyl coenzyme M reductase gamma subunit